MNIKRLIAVGTSGTILVLLSVGVVFAKPAFHSFNGGGQIVEDEYNISFGGNIKEDDLLRGQLEVNFHNVSNVDVSGGHFHSTEIIAANWFAPDTNFCASAMNATMEGKFNGEDGWRLVIRAGDDDDTLRFELHNTGGLVYDSWADDFSGESNCVGSARTGLDYGELKITN